MPERRGEEGLNYFKRAVYGSPMVKCHYYQHTNILKRAATELCSIYNFPVPLVGFCGSENDCQRDRVLGQDVWHPHRTHSAVSSFSWYWPHVIEAQWKHKILWATKFSCFFCTLVLQTLLSDWGTWKDIPTLGYWVPFFETQGLQESETRVTELLNDLRNSSWCHANLGD